VIFSGAEEMDREGNRQEQGVAPSFPGSEEGKTNSQEQAPGGGEERRQDWTPGTACTYTPQDEPGAQTLHDETEEKVVALRRFQNISGQIRFNRLVSRTTNGGGKIFISRVQPATTYYVRLLRG
jgi:hypothetical protein